MQDRSQSPRIYQSVIGKLDERERVELLSQPLQRDAATKCRGREACCHVSKGGRRRNRPGNAQSQVACTVTIKADAIAAQQPFSIAGLPLSKKFKVEVPDFLNGAYPLLGLRLVPRQVLKP